MYAPASNRHCCWATKASNSSLVITRLTPGGLDARLERELDLLDKGCNGLRARGFGTGGVLNLVRGAGTGLARNSNLLSKMETSVSSESMLRASLVLSQDSSAEILSTSVDVLCTRGLGMGGVLKMVRKARAVSFEDDSMLIVSLAPRDSSTERLSTSKSDARGMDQDED